MIQVILNTENFQKYKGHRDRVMQFILSMARLNEIKQIGGFVSLRSVQNSAENNELQFNEDTYEFGDTKVRKTGKEFVPYGKIKFSSDNF